MRRKRLASTEMEPAPETEEHARRPYLIVFAALAIVTLVELFVYSFPLAKIEIISILMATATMKGGLVVGYYMHLRYEPRWVALIPLGGLALVAVLVAALTATSAHP